MQKKVYEKKSEKVIDFLIGFILIPAFLIITSRFISAAVFQPNFSSIIAIFVLLAELVGIIYLSRKRKFIGIGLAYTFIGIPLVLLGTCLLTLGR